MSVFAGELEQLTERLADWLEGPCWAPSRSSVVFSDIPGNRVLEYLPQTGEVRVVENECEFTNGRTLDLDGSLVECSHGRRAVQRRRGDEVTVLVDHWGEHRLNSPNDVVVDSRGVIWFTDPAYGIEQEVEGHPGVREYGDRWVLRHDPATGAIDVAVTDVLAPNGLAFSPDEQLLYVADSSGAQNPSGSGHIRVYDVLEGRLCKNGRLFARIEDGVPDGIRVDAAGRLFSSAADGVHVYDPDGNHLEFLPVAEVVSNLCFVPVDEPGHLYLTGATRLYRVGLAT
ncbi:SMP-30/gluconolactonase/LRE family protein [Aestuariimicrobium ganziense]|uniref:SMP-30/gluconolactonase/LRE family protein n=1 Tax=Aestuariimicrobium ganziense TaxID=2773677 RepID=UPI0019444F5B|nr:SMP-30/gluconolactonase/LRE family protein [Aestuariimicrobium ganziense]